MTQLVYCFNRNTKFYSESEIMSIALWAVIVQTYYYLALLDVTTLKSEINTLIWSFRSLMS